MKTSIIIATYGDAMWEMLAQERAFPSTVKQGAHEVLVGHDTDGSISSVRNWLAEKASGEWLCFLDADDELAPGYLDAMTRAFEQEEGATPRTTALLLTPAVRQVKRSRPGRPFFFPECSLETGNWLVVGTLVTRELFNQVGGFHEYPHGLEDWNLWARCVRTGARIVKVKGAHYLAHFNRDSKHHTLQRDKASYMQAYEQARIGAWG